MDVPPTQVGEIELRDQPSRRVVTAAYAERVALHLGEAAAFQTRTPQPARREEQIDVRFGVSRPLWAGAASQGIPRLQQRPVERFAVVGHHNVALV